MIALLLGLALADDPPNAYVGRSLATFYVLAGAADVSVNGLIGQRHGWQPQLSLGVTTFLMPYVGWRIEHGLTRGPVPQEVTQLATLVDGEARSPWVGQFHMGFVLDPGEPAGPFFEVAMALHPIHGGWRPAYHQIGAGPVIAAGYRWFKTEHIWGPLVETGLRVEPLAPKVGGLAVPVIFYATFGLGGTIVDHEATP